MRQLTKDSCSILHLVLKKKWYDMIASGEKTEEYRDDTPFWSPRIWNWWECSGKTKVVAFQRGYRKPSMWFVVDGLGQCDYSSNPDWGEPYHPHITLFLGERVEIVGNENENKEKTKMVKIGFKMIHPDAKLPVKSHASDAGMDVYAVEDTMLSPFVPTLVKTGLVPCIPDGYEIQVRPRSGLALKQGITVLNSPGTVDSGYKAEIGVILMWMPQSYLRQDDVKFDMGYVVNKGDRIAQFVVAPVLECETCEVEDVGTSDRSEAGHNGFGSTGA